MKYITGTLLLFALLVGILSPFSVSAKSALGSACESAPDSVICKQSNIDNAETKTSTFIADIISLLFFAIGIIAVIMIIVGGLRYVTSNGDSSKLASAKNTILYSIVGLVVALLAYGIVDFVLTEV